jgi:Ca2+-binding EF-hand superfamily protein
MDDMYARISQFDEGGKGYLSKEEFFSMMEDLEGLGHEECEDLYREVDTDGNGVLSILEMCEYFKTHGVQQE